MTTADFIEIFEGESSKADDDGTPDWHWRAKSDNGETVFSGEGHTSSRDAIRAATGAVPGLPVFKVMPDGEKVPAGVHANRDSEIKSILGIPDSEPIFILRAQDKLAIHVIQEYAAMADEVGIPATFVEDVEDDVMAFTMWQKENPDRVKYPD